eukprot:gene6014-7492_t
MSISDGLVKSDQRHLFYQKFIIPNTVESLELLITPDVFKYPIPIGFIPSSVSKLCLRFIKKDNSYISNNARDNDNKDISNSEVVTARNNPDKITGSGKLITDQIFMDGSIPNSVESLTVVFSYWYHLGFLMNRGIIPSSVTEFSLDYVKCENFTLEPGMILSTVRRLKLNVCNQLKIGTIPDGVKYLKIKGMGIKSIPGGLLPKGLVVLDLMGAQMIHGDEIDYQAIPNTVTTMKIGICNVLSRLKFVGDIRIQLPSSEYISQSLKHLDLGNYFQDTIIRGSLPDGLESLSRVFWENQFEFAICAFTAVNAFDCEMCQFAYKVTEDMVSRNVSLNEVLPTLLSACGFHSEELSSKCQDIANEFPYQLIVSAMDSEDSFEACEQLGKCGKGLIGKHHDPIKKLKCSACKSIVRSAEKNINKSVDEGAAYARQQCKALGGLLSHECEKLVGSIYKSVYDALQRKEDPNQICNHLHMC